MTSDEVFEFLLQTNPLDDWQHCGTSWGEELFLKEDPRLRIRCSYMNEDIQNENFIEDWANCFPDRSASGYWFNLLLAGDQLERFLLVSVDGGRALLPAPEVGTNEVTLLKYHIARIHDQSGTLIQYLSTSGLVVRRV